MADNSELFSTLIQGLSALNSRVKEIEAYDEEIVLEINDFQSDYSKEIKLLHSRVDEINVQIFKLVKEEISKIEIKQGVDGKDYDETVAKALLKAELNKLVKQRNLETEKIKSEVLNAIEDIPIQKGDKGESGKDVTDVQVQNAVLSWIDDNFDRLKGEDGERGLQGLTGKSGSDGTDGISIVDAVIDKDYLVLTFSNGEEKRIRLPKQKVLVGGGSTNLKPLEDRVAALEEATPAEQNEELINRVDRLDLINMFNSAKLVSYTEYIKDENKNIIRVDVWEDDTKVSKLFTKDLTITNKTITQAVTTNNLTNLKVTRDLNYDLNGDIYNSYSAIA